jgi:DNA modification methylase
MTYQLFVGNNLEILPTLPDNSIDSIVTDPPYGLSDNKYVADTIARWISGERDFVPDGKGFMGKAWDAFVPPPALWDECLRVLKPGGHLLAFFGSRTQDIGALAIRLAGFEIRDSIAWLYGSGFPKSMDISKAIDKDNGKSKLDFSEFGNYVKECRESKGWSRKQLDEMMGTNTAVSWWEGRASGVQLPSLETYNRLKPMIGMDNRFDDLIDWAEAEREIIGKGSSTLIAKSGTYAITNGEAGEVWEPKDYNITAPSTPEAQQWQGWGTALKPALEPIVVARKPIEGTVANNVLKWGTGGLNIDGSRIGTETISTHHAPKGTFAGGEQDRGSDTSSYKEHSGRWPANIILSHTELCNPTGQTLKNKTSAGKRTATFGTQDTQSGGDGSGGWSGYEYETEVYECVEGCPVKLLDEQSGTSKSSQPSESVAYGAGIDTNSNNILGKGLSASVPNVKPYGDTGGASRFFYVAKASKRDRNEGLDELPTKGKVFNGTSPNSAGMAQGSVEDRFTNQPAQNFHPTVKPTALMEYLVKLVTPPNGTVLDPFTGSGSTGKAAILQGFNFIGIEMTEEYVPIIEGRLKHAEAKVAGAKENQEAQPKGLF